MICRTGKDTGSHDVLRGARDGVRARGFARGVQTAKRERMLTTAAHSAGTSLGRGESVRPAALHSAESLDRLLMQIARHHPSTRMSLELHQAFARTACVGREGQGA